MSQKRTTVAWRYEAGLFVVVHTSAPPTRAEWQEFVTDLSTHGCGTDKRILVRSYGGGPDSAQRKAMSEVPKNNITPVAVMTSNMAARAIGTAISWFNPHLKMFAVHGLEAAAQHLKMTDVQRERGRRLLVLLEQELGIGPLVGPSDDVSPRP